MFFHNINPVAFTLGPLEIRYYGLVYFLGFLFAYFYLRYQVKQSRIKHFGLDDVDTFMIFFMLGSILGARILDFVFFNPQILFSNPAQILRIWEGGMSIHGGIIGAVIGTWLFVRKRKVKFYDLADKIIAPVMIFLGLGRIANFINAELWGTQFSGRFCVDYSQNEYIRNAPQGCRHPYQLYESVKNFAVGIFLIVYSSYYKLKSGLLFWWGILLYNVLRFFVDFYRDDPTFYGLNTGQYLAIVFSIVSVIFIIKIQYYSKEIIDQTDKQDKKHKHNKHKK